MTSFRKYS